MTSPLVKQDLTTCVYVVEGDEYAGYRASGTVFSWQGSSPVAVGDDVVIEGPAPCPCSSGKVLSVFKILAEDTQRMLKAFSTMEEMRSAGFAI